MAVTLSVDQLTADTQELYLRTVEDQVHDRIPLVHKLKKLKRVVTKGGRYVTKPLRYAKNTQTQNYATGAPMNSGTENKRTAAKFNWRKTTTPIKYTCDDEIENDGEQAIVDTIAEEVKSAQEDMMDSLSLNFFGIYNGSTVASPGTTDPLSLNAAFYGGATTYGGLAVYGGITRSAIGDWWDGNVDDGTARNNPTTVSFNHWDYMVDKCLQHRGNRKSLLAVCGSTLYHKWKSLVRAKEAEIDITGMLAKAGFASFSIDGVELVLDDNCPANYFYMLDLETWEWRISPKRNFKVTPFKWQGEVNQGVDEYLARILLAHTGLICWKPRNNYMATNMA
jgi:hypothetical protein